MILSARPPADDLCSSALAYAKRGWRVLPVHSVDEDGNCTCGRSECASVAKHPIIPNWTAEASTEDSTLSHWWTQAPQANVGIATGSASGVFVLDLDGPTGIAMFNAWCAEHGEPPPTYTVETPGGGMHLYFRYPSDRSITNRAKIDGKPIDVRGEGGYVLAPPSLHKCGRRYRVDVDANVAEAPLWLLDRIAPSTPPPSTTSVPTNPSPPPGSPHNAGRTWPRASAPISRNAPPAISGSGGHATTYATACALVQGFGLPPAEAYSFLAEWNAGCLPAWTEKELRHKLEDAETKGKPPERKQRGYLASEQVLFNVSSQKASLAPPDARFLPVDEWEPFPTSALPEPLRSIVVEGAKALGCDEAFLAVPVLPIVAGAIGNARRIKPKRTWREPVTIWSAVVADSGTMKSPSLDLIVRPVHDIQSTMFDDFSEAQAEHETRVVEYERDLAQWRKGKGTEKPPEKPAPPVCRRIVVADTTVEKLAVLLQENQRGIVIVRDELAGWLNGMNAYKAKGGADVANYFELHRAGTVVVDRKSGGTIHVRRANVSITGGIQPGVFARAMRPEYHEAGLGARLLVAMPPRKDISWTEAELDEEIERAYADLIRRLLELAMRTDDDGQECPWDLEFTPEAKDVWIAYYNCWGKIQADAEETLARVFAKIEGYALRFALQHHIVTHVHAKRDDITPIGRESMEAGIVLADWFAREARRVYAILGESQEERDAELGRAGCVTFTRNIERGPCQNIWPTSREVWKPGTTLLRGSRRYPLRASGRQTQGGPYSQTRFSARWRRVSG